MKFSLNNFSTNPISELHESSFIKNVPSLDQGFSIFFLPFSPCQLPNVKFTPYFLFTHYRCRKMYNIILQFTPRIGKNYSKESMYPRLRTPALEDNAFFEEPLWMFQPNMRWNVFIGLIRNKLFMFHRSQTTYWFKSGRYLSWNVSHSHREAFQPDNENKPSKVTAAFPRRQVIQD